MATAHPVPLLSGQNAWATFVSALEAAGLPTQDLAEKDQFFFALMEENQPVAFGGYALLGKDALLRSLVVPFALRGQGNGVRMLGYLMRTAAQAGARRAWLLTSAPEFFLRQGFVHRSRSDCPPAVAATPEFSSLCPASSSFMFHELTV